MIKDHIDYKLMNISLIILIIFLILKTSSFWLGVVSVLWKLCFPFFCSFILSCFLYPIKRKLNKIVPNFVSVLIIVFFIFIIIFLFIFSVLPPLVKEIPEVLERIIFFLREMSFKYNIDFNAISNFFINIYSDFLNQKSFFSVLNTSINILFLMFLIFVSFIYLLSDMDKIRNKIKIKLKNNRVFYEYFKCLDQQMNNYLSGFLQIIIITFFEYLLLYFIIGHPNFLLLAILASLANLIPFFGSVVVNIIAFITVFANPILLIKTCIIWIVCMVLDGYIINPLVFSKQNHLHPLLIIVIMFVSGHIGGIFGMVLALPIAIISLHTYTFVRKRALF